MVNHLLENMNMYSYIEIYSSDLFIQVPNYFVATFDKERLVEFNNHDDEENFFTPAERGVVKSELNPLDIDK